MKLVTAMFLKSFSHDSTTKSGAMAIINWQQREKKKQHKQLKLFSESRFCCVIFAVKQQVVSSNNI
jgi:hypothetical protein